MKKFNNIEELEQLIKSGADKATATPPPGAWEAISSSVGGAAAAGTGAASTVTSISTLVKAVLFIGGISTIGVVVYKANQPTAPSIDRIETISAAETENNKDNSVIEQLPVDVKEEAETQEIKSTTSTPESPKNGEQGTYVDVNPDGTAYPIAPPISDINNNLKEGTPKAGNGDKNPGKASENSIIEASNARPCKGELVSLSVVNGQKGNWFVDGKKVANDTKDCQIKCEKPKTEITHVNGDKKSVFTLYSQSLNADITSKDLENGQYAISLSEKGIIANWYVDGNLVETNAQKINYLFSSVGKHTIKAVPTNHVCSNTIESELLIEPKGSIKPFNNIFTPNGDGINDTYTVEIEGYQNFSMQIFNLKGEKVFVSLDPNTGWDGSMYNAGLLCPDGEYIMKVSYQLKGEKPEEKSQRLMLKRKR